MQPAAQRRPGGCKTGYGHVCSVKHPSCRLPAPPGLKAITQNPRQRTRPGQVRHVARCAAAVHDRKPGISTAPQELQPAAPLNKPPVELSALHDPAHIGASAKTSIKVKDLGGPVALGQYMKLPVEQYFELDPQMIKPLAGNRYLLQVPRVHLFNIWVEPLVEVAVKLVGNQVVIESVNCRIHGSDLVQRMRLDQRFCLAFTSVLTWQSTPTQSSGSSHANGEAGNGASWNLLRLGRQNEQHSEATTTASNGTLQLDSQPAEGEIMGHTSLDVWCEVVSPFNLLPRGVLEATSNAVMAALVRSLLPVFMRKLGQDYTRWATDAEYRARRQSIDSRTQMPARV